MVFQVFAVAPGEILSFVPIAEPTGVRKPASLPRFRIASQALYRVKFQPRPEEDYPGFSPVLSIILAEVACRLGC